MNITGTYRSAWSTSQETLLQSIPPQLTLRNARDVRAINGAVLFAQANYSDSTGLIFRIVNGSFSAMLGSEPAEISFRARAAPRPVMWLVALMGSISMAVVASRLTAWFYALPLSVLAAYCFVYFAVRNSASQWLEEVCSHAELSVRGDSKRNAA